MSDIYILAPQPCAGARALVNAHDQIHFAGEGHDPPPDNAFVVRWGTQARIGAQYRYVNTPEAIALAADKTRAREVLGPLVPTTWTMREQVHLPCIIRPQRHHGGHRFYVCRKRYQIDRAIQRCGEGWYASAIVNKAREFRIFVLYGRIVAVSERFPPEGPRKRMAWNSRRDGSLRNCRSTMWHHPSLLASVDAMVELNLDWGAVDVAVDQAGRPFVLEVNTKPGLENTYTLDRIARAFVRLAKTGLPEDAPAGEWRLFPGVTSKKVRTPAQ